MIICSETLVSYFISRYQALTNNKLILTTILEIKIAIYVHKNYNIVGFGRL